MEPSVSIAQRLRWTGIILFSASFLMPDIESGNGGLAVSMKDCGFHAFLMTPVLFIGLLGEISSIGNLLWACLVGVAWLNNFMVFMKFPPSLAWIPISIPWALLSAAAVDPVHLGSLWAYVPFYPWAMGIGLIHAPAYVEPSEIFDRWISEF